MTAAMPASPVTSPKAFILAPLTGFPLVMITLVVWTAGAFYCHGYERMVSGGGEWPGAYFWSAISVMPWLALFEWTKRPLGQRIVRSPAGLALALVTTAAFSVGFGALAEFITGSNPTPFGLALLRRFPPIAASLILILWARAETRQSAPATDSGDQIDLASLAPSIDWVEAADNYVELHTGKNVLIRRMTMATAERILERHGFVRIHRRFLINRARIERILGSNGNRSVVIAATRLPIGPRYAARLKA